MRLTQSTLDDVEALLKRHDDFENTLMAQDERLRVFSEMADKLIAAEHYDAKYINDRRDQVGETRNHLSYFLTIAKMLNLIHGSIYIFILLAHFCFHLYA